jgi:hypothetical protein
VTKPKTTWLTIAGQGQTCLPNGSDVQRAEPLRASPVQPTLPLAPNAQLVLAGLDDAAVLESAYAGDDAFRWSELSSADISHLVALHCLIDGVDPSMAVEDTPSRRNPFTGDRIRLTAFDRAFASLEIVLGGKLVLATAEELDGAQPDALVFRLPRSFVARLAALSAGESGDLADRWAREWSPSSPAPPFTTAAASRDIDALISAARAATAETREVFVWMAG